MADKALRLGAIGAGNMATALMGGIVRARLAAAQDCLASDIKAEARETFEKATGVRATGDSQGVLRRCDVILLAVKPQNMAEALAALKPCAEARHLFISIAAGVTTAFIEKALDGQARVVRVMPNTPALLGAGAAAIAPGAHSTRDDLALALRLMNAVGIAVEVAEADMDAVTALSGSGPAYFFYFVEQLIAAGVAQGLAPDVAEKLAKQTALGAARMLNECLETPERLRIAVTSPGGTTEVALKAFAEGGFPALVQRAVKAATDRGRELGNR